MAVAVPSAAFLAGGLPEPKLAFPRSAFGTSAPSSLAVNLRLPSSTFPAKTEALHLVFHRKRRLRTTGTFCSIINAAVTDDGQSPQPSRASDLVHGFYSAVNDKDMKKLAELLSEDCILEDLIFSKPCSGRKEVTRFFQELAKAMGKNVRFVLESVYEEKAAAAVLWHLEWQGKRIPCTRGCSFYDFTPDPGRLLIRRALVVVESPIKPGEIVVKLLKIITTAFDKFPTVAERFLGRPGAIVQFMKRIFDLFVKPLIFPFMFYYVHIWNSLIKLLERIFMFFM